MRDPYVSTAKWLIGRLAWLAVIVAILVVLRLYGDESRLWLAEIRGLAPDAGLVQALEQGREELEQFARERTREAQRRLDAAWSASAAAIDQRIEAIGQEIDERQAKSRPAVERTLALLTGGDFRQDFRNDIELRLLAAERDALERLRRQLERERGTLEEARRSFERARRAIIGANDAYRAARAELERLEREHPVAVLIPGTAEHRRASELRPRVEALLRRAERAADEFYAARDGLRTVRARTAGAAAALRSTADAALAPLEQFVSSKQADLAASERRLRRIGEAVQAALLPALLILVAVTLSPIAIKAFWFFVAAPIASRRPPIHLAPGSTGGLVLPGVGDAPAATARRSVSAVSQALAVDEQHEALVHPAYLQSSSVLGRKDTKWLLDRRYPFTSLASGMVALTRIHGTSAGPFVVSSKNDPFSEIGVLELPGESAIALQPRSLVGVIQRRGTPIHIESHWRLGSLSAWLTLQLRYLVFHGPATLIVQGCRGVRVERAGSGRSIDQAATIGFDAKLAYSTTRSETFGAYLLGEHGLFNDHFDGGPGHYVYEEMPYFRRRTGITGRGLEGLTDALLKAFGV